MDFIYHDTKLRSIDTEDSGDIILSFENYSGMLFSLTLKGTTHFCCDNFRETNVVFDCKQLDKDEVKKDDIERLLQSVPEDGVSKHDAVLNSLELDQCVFFKLTPSYGARVLALCKLLEENSFDR